MYMQLPAAVVAAVSTRGMKRTKKILNPPPESLLQNTVKAKNCTCTNFLAFV